MSTVVFPIKYTKLGASAKEFLKFVQYDHSTNRLKMAKSLKRGQIFFLQPSHVGTLSRRAEKPDGMQKELVQLSSQYRRRKFRLKKIYQS